MKRLVLLSLSIVLVASACGGDSGGGGGDVSSPCDLADAALIQSVFGGTVAEGSEGEARNCSFSIEGGPLSSVSIFWFGPASGWEGTREGYVANRGGVTEMSGIGDGAFHPNDSGPIEVVAQAGGEVFAISVFNAFTELPPETSDLVSDLAKAIADSRG
jgi:hypothetical protein